MKHYIQDIMLYIAAPFIGFKKMAAGYKLGSLMLTSFILAPFVWISDVLTNHVFLSAEFVKILVLALVIDVVTGAMKHLKLKTFDWRELFTGFTVKVAISFMGMAMFNSFASMEDFNSTPAFRDYFILIGKLCNFLYVGGSAFNNMFIVTNGKFPPVSWMSRMKKFNDTLSVSDLTGKVTTDEAQGKLLNELIEAEKDPLIESVTEEKPKENGTI